MYNINDIVNEYVNGNGEISLTKLSRKYNISRRKLTEEVKKRGFEVINYLNLARMNENYFDVIDTEEKAYWLGFLFADGCIGSTSYKVEVHLALKDLEHLEKFKSAILFSSKIRIGTNDHNILYCHLSFRNKHMWNRLKELGCIPNKTLYLKFPDINIFKKKRFVIDFIRGYCDGDGCLCTYKKCNSLSTQISFVGTYDFLDFINKLFCCKNKIRNKSYKNYSNKAFLLSYSGCIARKIARLLYCNASIYLQRKYDKYLYFCQIEEESSKRKSSKIGGDCDVNTEVIYEIAKGLLTL